MSSMNDHCLDSGKLKKGVKLPLFNMDGGISDDFIMVRWAWTDEVRAAMDELKRDMRQRFADEKDPDSDGLVLDGIVAQVAGWSFKEKATKTNVRKFLKSRPDIAERIDILSANTKVFFTDSGASS